MNRIRNLVLGCAIALVTSPIALATTIMPFGDSITGGFHGTPDNRGSYRRYLEDQFTALNFQFDMVGNYRRGVDGLIDADYQAVGGFTIEKMVEGFGEAIGEHQPDFLLILAGTNNHWHAPDLDAFVNRYETLVQLAREHSPSSRLVFATVPPMGCCWLEKAYWTPDFVAERNEIRIPNMNAAINIVAERHENVTIAEYNKAFDITADLTSDQVHPNRQGQRKLGRVFLEELGHLRFGLLDANHIDRLANQIVQGTETRRGDLNSDGVVDLHDHSYLVHNVMGTVVGDGNLDGQFDSDDLLAVFKQGEYEDEVVGNSGWADGDWNADGEFDSGDLIDAYLGGLGSGLSNIVAPEATSMNAQLLVLLFVSMARRSRAHEM